MVVCSVKTCGVSSYTIKKENLKIKLHAFPTDQVRRKRWLAFCNSNFASDEASCRLFICSQHFQKEDYHNVMDEDFRRHTLVRNAIPSIRHPPSEKLSDRDIRAYRKNRTEMVSKLLEQSDRKASVQQLLPLNMKEIVQRYCSNRNVECSSETPLEDSRTTQQDFGNFQNVEQYLTYCDSAYDLAKTENKVAKSNHTDTEDGIFFELECLDPVLHSTTIECEDPETERKLITETQTSISKE